MFSALWGHIFFHSVNEKGFVISPQKEHISPHIVPYSFFCAMIRKKERAGFYEKNTDHIDRSGCCRMRGLVLSASPRSHLSGNSDTRL